MQLLLDIYTQSPDLVFLQQQIDAQAKSLDKMRKKLFAEISALKKSNYDLNESNNLLKGMLYDLSNQKTHWVYRQNDCLFDVREHQAAGY